MIKFGFVNLIKKSYFLLILIFLVQCTSQGEKIILKDYQWVDRILLIHSKNPEFVDAQLEYLSEPNELIERDLVVIYRENEKFKISSDGLKTINTLDNESMNNITHKFFLKGKARGELLHIYLNNKYCPPIYALFLKMLHGLHLTLLSHNGH